MDKRMTKPAERHTPHLAQYAATIAVAFGALMLVIGKLVDIASDLAMFMTGFFVSATIAILLFRR